MSWTWADPDKRDWSREQLLEYIDAAHGIICNAHRARVDHVTEADGASPGWAGAARSWIDAYPPVSTAADHARLRAVADAARIFHAKGPDYWDGTEGDPEWVTLGAALAALDGGGERDAADELSVLGQDMRLGDEPRPYTACWGPDVDA